MFYGSNLALSFCGDSKHSVTWPVRSSCIRTRAIPENVVSSPSLGMFKAAVFTHLDLSINILGLPDSAPCLEYPRGRMTLGKTPVTPGCRSHGVPTAS